MIVNHRTGGLEKHFISTRFNQCVNHRTGGLENIINFILLALMVNHRTGGLENFLKDVEFKGGCSTPHKYGLGHLYFREQLLVLKVMPLIACWN